VSKLNVTDAVYQFLQPSVSNITSLGKLYSALPRIASEADLFTNTYPGLGYGATIFMFITSQTEQRIALGGPVSGRKFRTYDLGLLMVFKSDMATITEGLGQGTPEEAAQAAFDTFVDSLLDYIESNNTAGNPSVVFQWGEGGDRGGTDLHFDYTVPRTLNGGVMIFQGVGHVTVAEMLTT
jgi:hypothetical protein